MTCPECYLLCSGLYTCKECLRDMCECCHADHTENAHSSDSDVMAERYAGARVA